MSLVTTASATSSRSARHSAATSAVLPEPTGPPIPIRSARPARGGAWCASALWSCGPYPWSCPCPCPCSSPTACPWSSELCAPWLCAPWLCAPWLCALLGLKEPHLRSDMRFRQQVQGRRGRAGQLAWRPVRAVGPLFRDHLDLTGEP